MSMVSVSGLCGAGAFASGVTSGGVYLASLTGAIGEDFPTWPIHAMLIGLCIFLVWMNDKANSRASKAMIAMNAEDNRVREKSSAESVAALNAVVLEMRRQNENTAQRNELEAKRDERGQTMSRGIQTLLSRQGGNDNQDQSKNEDA